MEGNFTILTCLCTVKYDSLGYLVTAIVPDEILSYNSSKNEMHKKKRKKKEYNQNLMEW